MSLFTAHCISDLLGILRSAFANADLFAHDRLLLNIDTLLAHWHAVGLILIANRCIRWYLTGDRMSLDVHFLAIDRHIQRLLFSYHILTDTHLPSLNALLICTQL